MNSRSYLWLFPFISFLIGYAFLYHVLYVVHVQTPHLVGKPLDQAVEILTQANLNMRLLHYKEEPTLPAGIILSQSPQAGQQIKAQQSVFLVVSRQAPTPRAPSVIDQRWDSEEYNAIMQGIKQKVYRLPSHYPHNHCIAQIPAAGDPLENSSMIVYVADSTAQKIIWPHFINKRVSDVREFLQSHDIAVDSIHAYQQPADHECRDCTVIDQRPLPGSLITLEGKNKQLQVQLLVQ